MNTPHNASESAKLIIELRTEIANDQREIKNIEPRLRALEQAIAAEKAKLAKEEAEKLHEETKLRELKGNLMHTEQEFAQISREIQQMNLGAKH